MKQAIEKAIEGGWKSKINLNGIPLTNKNWEAQMVMAGGFAIAWFLDPLFWQALGKSIGWDKINEQKAQTISKSGGISSNFGYHTLHQWYRFIDHLSKGKDTESFFNELFK